MLRAQDLPGRRIGIRSWTVTTVMWLRGILAEQGVDPGSVTWVTFEEPHVAEFVDPPHVQHAPSEKTLAGMLIAGEIDAAVLGEPVNDPRIRTVFEDPQAAAQSWRHTHGALQITPRSPDSVGSSLLPKSFHVRCPRPRM